MRSDVMSVIVSAALAAGVLVVGACEEKKAAPAPAAGAGSTAPKDDGHGHEAGHEHGAGLELGSASIGGFDVKAARGEGKIAAGKEALFDVTVTGGAGAKVGSVRFWIGTQDAKGSVKAKAEIEDPKHPEGWHGHAEVPDPLPADSKLWVEIEDEKGTKSVGSFDLKN